MANLLRQAWASLLLSRDLPRYTFANGAPAFYFKKELLPSDKAWFRDLQGVRSWRAMVGHKTIKKADAATVGILRYWHFALEAKPTVTPILGFTAKPHVLFSDDGQTIWSNKDRLHRARRSQCRGWWNDKWRDLISAAMAVLAGGDNSGSEGEPGLIRLPVGPDQTLDLSSCPFLLTSPVSYVEPTNGLAEPAAGRVEDPDDFGDEDVEEAEVSEALGLEVEGR